MADINAVPARFENGGALKIGADTILHVEMGTLEWVPPMNAKIPLKDRGVIRPSREGDQEPGSLSFDVRYTSTTSATELISLITKNGNNVTDLGAAPSYTIVIDYPGYRGATTGKRKTFTLCTPAEAPRVTAGTEFDRMSARFVVNGTLTEADY